MIRRHAASWALLSPPTNCSQTGSDDVGQTTIAGNGQSPTCLLSCVLYVVLPVQLPLRLWLLVKSTLTRAGICASAPNATDMLPCHGQHEA